MTISRSSGAALGEARLVISNFIQVDPTGGGGAIEPMSTDGISSAVASNTVGSSATANFGGVNLPAWTSEVLLEVFSHRGWQPSGTAEAGGNQSGVRADHSGFLGSGHRLRCGGGKRRIRDFDSDRRMVAGSLVLAR